MESRRPGSAIEIGQGKGDAPPLGPRNLDRAAHGAARLFRTPEIAFEEQSVAAADRILIQRVGGQAMAGRGRGLHRALAIGRHHDEAAPRGRAAVRRSVERDVQIGHVPLEQPSEPVIAREPDEPAARAQRRRARQAVRRGTAGDFLDRAAGCHCPGQRLGLAIGEQAHRALEHAAFGKEILAPLGKHVDDGVAERYDLGRVAVHRGNLRWIMEMSAPLAASGQAGQSPCGRRQPV